MTQRVNGGGLPEYQQRNNTAVDGLRVLQKRNENTFKDHEKQQQALEGRVVELNNKLAEERREKQRNREHATIDTIYTPLTTGVGLAIAGPPGAMIAFCCWKVFFTIASYFDR